ncbi:hypothetical protein NCCP2495_30890 [Dietzia sp. NCCP-2495]|nr:hypothetical protein NCCP2495_30890 [Dietzia sp. NCCP-2495]
MLVGLAAVGGGLGAAGRYAVDEWVSARWRRDYPLGTLIVNVTGSFLLGVLVGLLVEDASGSAAGSAGVMALLGTGVLGGYTTFSTASLGTVKLALDGRRGPALLYGLGTLLASVAAAGLGLWLGSQ